MSLHAAVEQRRHEDAKAENKALLAPSPKPETFTRQVNPNHPPNLPFPGFGFASSRLCCSHPSAAFRVKLLLKAFQGSPIFSTLAALLCLAPLAAYAEDYTYITNNGTITITGYTGPGGVVVIPGTITSLPVTALGQSAFASCTSLTSVTIPDSVTGIGGYAFSLCTNLLSATIGNSVTSIGMNAFSRCHSLASIALPNSVISIDQYAFRYCTSLTNVILPNSLAFIPYMGFYSCTSLRRITLPSSVTLLDWYAFRDCTNLLAVYCRGNAPTALTDVFLGDNQATVYYLPGTTGWGSTLGGRPALLWNPQIQAADGTFGVRTNRFGFTITGTTNIPILIEAATNLTASCWTPLQTCTLTNASIYFSDPDWTNHPIRFYRIRSP
jgi:hypothetical protein